MPAAWQRLDAGVDRGCDERGLIDEKWMDVISALAWVGVRPWPTSGTTRRPGVAGDDPGAAPQACPS